MSAPCTAPSHRAQNPPADTRLGLASIAELVTRLCGMHRVNDHLVRIKATLGNEGYIALDVTRFDSTGEDPTVRVLRYPTVTIAPGPGAA